MKLINNTSRRAKLIQHTYKMFGPHVIAIPPGVQLKPLRGQPEQLAMTPLDEALNMYEKEGWRLVQVLPGMNLMVQTPGSNLALPGKQPGNMQIPGAWALMRKIAV